MKHTMKKPSYYLLSQAMDGDEKAIEKILAFYDPYISKCCLRPLYDEYGNVYIVVDMELRGLIRENKTIRPIIHTPNNHQCTIAGSSPTAILLSQKNALYP